MVFACIKTELMLVASFKLANQCSRTKHRHSICLQQEPKRAGQVVTKMWGKQLEIRNRSSNHVHLCMGSRNIKSVAPSHYTVPPGLDGQARTPRMQRLPAAREHAKTCPSHCNYYIYLHIEPDNDPGLQLPPILGHGDDASACRDAFLHVAMHLSYTGER